MKFINDYKVLIISILTYNKECSWRDNHENEQKI